MNAAPEVKGWCPGALRPMASGDGLLLRAKTIGSALPADTARDIADIAACCGNGLIDLSQRAQLQLRGVSEATLDEALRRLDELSLLAPDAATESVLNILASPLAGLDARAPLDANKSARELARAIAQDALLRALPGKFLFLVDDGGALSLAGADADIRIEAGRHDDAAVYAVSLAGAGDLGVFADASAALDVALDLARAFVARRKGREFELRRMRLLTAEIGAAAVFGAAGLEAPQSLTKPRVRPHPGAFGVHAGNEIFYTGVGAAFGRWRAVELSAVAALAAETGTGELRLTPWRAMLIPAATPGAARKICAAAARLGLIVDAGDPRLAVAACPGAPECPQALGPTRADLDRLAPLARALAPEGVTLHVSGCAKGCARPVESRATLVARGERYDFIEGGRAADAPSRPGLTLDEATLALAEIAGREAQPCRAH